jgi:DNA repair protein SbcD/Mre11
MKLVLFSDLHLDTQFAWLGSRDAARRRREALRRALVRIVQLAVEEQADALLCGGDLYEHDRFTPDTAAFLRGAFESLHPTPVFVAPGNHDWYGPQSLYRRVAWTDNVHVFAAARLEPVTLADGLTLWGAAHCAPAGTGGFLNDFHVDRAGIHLALFHGSESGGLPDQGEDKLPHAPFDASDLTRSGLHHALLGHYHVPRDASHHTYPGNPEPLAFGETGVRGAVLVTVQTDGSVERARRVVASTAPHDLEVAVDGCRSRGDIAARVAASLQHDGGIVRVTLTGEIEPEVDLVAGDLTEIARQMESDPTIGSRLEAVMVRFGDLRPAYDFDAIRGEATVRGQFVRDVLESELDPPLRQRVLITGLRALDGRDDLEVP